jgi:hypothetical protein
VKNKLVEHYQFRADLPTCQQLLTDKDIKTKYLTTSQCADSRLVTKVS